MANKPPHRIWIWALGLALFGVALQLGWELAHGGVKSHHLLARADMPAVSNWWGILVLPLLGWLASRAVTGRVSDGQGTVAGAGRAFVGALLVGAALSVAFATETEPLPSVIFFSALAAGLFLPTYRIEYVFGFVLGMTFVFGPVIPLIAACVAAGVSAAAHRLVRPAFGALLGKGRR